MKIKSCICVISLLLALALMLPYTAAVAAKDSDISEIDSESGQVLYGDVDSDGRINMKDVLALRKHISRHPISINFAASDVDLNGDLSMLDALYIRKYIAKQPVKLGDKDPERKEFRILTPTVTVTNGADFVDFSVTVSGKHNKIIITSDDGKISREFYDSSAEPYVCRIDGLDSGTEYSFSVMATNDVGMEHFESPTASVLAATLLNAPHIWTMNTDKNSVTLGFSADLRSDLVNIYIKSATDSDFRLIKTVDIDDCTVNIDGLIPAHEYEIQAMSEDSDSDLISDYSEPIYLQIPPESAAKLTAEGIGTGSIALKWDEASGADSYKITRSQGGDFTQIAVVSETEYTDTKLETASEYTYKVQSIIDSPNGEIQGDETIISAATNSPALNARVSDVSDSELEVEWDLDEYCNSVEIYLSKHNENNYSLVKTAPAKSGTAKIGGLQSLTEYDVKLRGVGKAGKSVMYSAYAEICSGVTALSAPIISVGSCSSSELLVSWEKNESYKTLELYLCDYDNNVFNLVKTADAALDSCKIDGLESGKRYYVKARAVSEYNDNTVYSNFSELCCGTVYLVTPTVSVKGLSSSQVQISWTAKSSYDSVEIYYAKGENGKYKKAADADAADGKYTIGSLTAGTRYYVKLRAMKSQDEYTLYSNYSTPYYGTTLPKDVTGFTVSAKTYSTVTLKWNKSDGAAQYKIYRSRSKNSGYSKIATVTAQSYTDKKLSDNTTYYYQIRSCFSIGDKEYHSNYAKISVKTDQKINYTVEKYGTSYQGRDLTAYIFNPSASKTVFADFAVHGFEDSYDRDGQVLVDCANKLVEYYNSHLSELNGYRLVLVPCANPDGTYAGKNNQRACSTAFGRCTADHIDINRDFISGGFKAKESRALRDLIKKYKPTYYLNFHGWEDSTLGDSTIGKIFRSELSLTTNKDGRYGADLGYIIGWVKNNVGSKACLVEFKSPSTVDYKKVIKGFARLVK